LWVAKWHLQLQNKCWRNFNVCVLIIRTNSNPVFEWPYGQCVNGVTNERSLFNKRIYCNSFNHRTINWSLHQVADGCLSCWQQMNNANSGWLGRRDGLNCRRIWRDGLLLRCIKENYLIVVMVDVRTRVLIGFDDRKCIKTSG